MIRYLPILITTLLFCSCNSSSSQKTENTLSLNIRDEPQTLDPRKARNLSDQTMIKMFFEGLARICPEGTPQLALANRMEVSSDFKTYTFHLKHARWSNGDPVTAEDFAFAWQTALDPAFLADNAYQLYVIKNARQVKEGKLEAHDLCAKALDPMTLQVELTHPVPYFLELLASPIFFPVNHRIDEMNSHWAERADSYVCNGPYILAKWKHCDVIEAKKNGAYWDAEAVSLDTIACVMINEATEYKMYQNREIDWAGSPFSTLPLDALKDLKKSGALHTTPVLGTRFLRLNTEDPLLKNVSFRKALGLAIDRKALTEYVLEGGQIPAAAFVPSCMNLQHKAHLFDAGDELARTLFYKALQETGDAKDKIDSLVLLYPATEVNHLIAQTLQEQWLRTLGIKVRLESVEPKISFSRISKGSYQIAMGSWMADFNDPINFLDIFRSKQTGMNNTAWEHDGYRALLQEAALTTDLDARFSLLGQSEELLMDEMPVIPLFHSVMMHVHHPKVRNVFISPLGGVDFKWAYVDGGGQ